MAARIETLRIPDARRIAALGASFLVHAGAALVVALPLAPPLRPARAPVETVVLHEDPPPLPPIPDEPRAPHVERTKPTVHRLPHASAPSLPVAIDAVPDAPSQSEPIEPASRVVAVGADAGDAAAGENRQLAYASPLHLRYPSAAMRQREQGRVLLHVLVDAQGAVQQVEIARSSGHVALDAAAREAVREARFRPVLRGGLAVAAWGLVPIEFRLDGG